MLGVAECPLNDSLIIGIQIGILVGAVLLAITIGIVNKLWP